MLLLYHGRTSKAAIVHALVLPASITPALRYTMKYYTESAHYLDVTEYYVNAVYLIVYTYHKTLLRKQSASYTESVVTRLERFCSNAIQIIFAIHTLD